MAKKGTIFNEWAESRDNVWFNTRSKYPDIDYYLSPEQLPTCSNRPSHLYEDFTMEEVNNYFMEQVAILRFNNPTLDKIYILSVILGRLIHWSGNIVLKKDPYIIKSIVPDVVDEVFSMDDYTYLINMDHTRNWYSDAIERLPGQKGGKPWGEKTRAKQLARSSVQVSAKREDMKFASEEYKKYTFNILPTAKDLSVATTYSVPTVSKYGVEYFISKKVNTEQKIHRYRKMYPELRQEGLSKVIGVSVRTIKSYWK